MIVFNRDKVLIIGAKDNDGGIFGHSRKVIKKKVRQI